MPVIQDKDGNQLKLINNQWVPLEAQPPIAQNAAGDQRILIDNNWVEYSNGNAFDAKSNSWYPVGAGEYQASNSDGINIPALMEQTGANHNPFTDMPDNAFTRLARDAAIIGLTGNVAGVYGAATNLPKAITTGANYVSKILNPTTVSQAAQGGAVIGGIDRTIDVAVDDSLTTGEKVLEVAKATGISAVTGGATQGVLNKVLGTRIDADVNQEQMKQLIAKKQALGAQLTKEEKHLLDANTLLEEGIELAPGQGRTGLIARLEKYANEAPIFGGRAQAARQKAEDSLNLNRVNNSLSHVNKELTPNTAPGNPAIKQADDAISREYQRINQPLSVQLDKHLMVDLENIVPNQTTRNNILQELNQNNSYDYWSKSLNKIVNDKNYTLNKPNYIKLQAAIKRAADRQAPGSMDDAERAFASLNTVKDAANDVDAPNQVFNARQYLKAVQDNSNKRSFTRGEAFDQEIAQAADNVMTQTDDIASGVPSQAFLSNVGHEAAALITRPYYGRTVQNLVRANDAGSPASNVFSLAVERLLQPSIEEQKARIKSNVDVYKMLVTQ